MGNTISKFEKDYDNNENWQVTDTDLNDILYPINGKEVINEIISQITNFKEHLNEASLLNKYDEIYFDLKTSYADNIDLLEQIEHAYFETYKKVLYEMSKSFGFSTDMLNADRIGTNKEDIIFFINTLYNLFISNYKDTIKGYLLDYIYKNINNINESYKVYIASHSDEIKKDKFFISLSKQITNEKALNVIYYAPAILKQHITDMINDEPEKAINNFIIYDEYNINMQLFKKYFIENESDTYLNNNFFSNILAPLVNGSLFDVIVSLIRYDLCKKFMKK